MSTEPKAVKCFNAFKDISEGCVITGLTSASSWKRKKHPVVILPASDYEALVQAAAKRPFTVEVEIPELEEGFCNTGCYFNDRRCRCNKGLAADNYFLTQMKPGPNCPRFPKEGL